MYICVGYYRSHLALCSNRVFDPQSLARLSWFLTPWQWFDLWAACWVIVSNHCCFTMSSLNMTTLLPILFLYFAYSLMFCSSFQLLMDSTDLAKSWIILHTCVCMGQPLIIARVDVGTHFSPVWVAIASSIDRSLHSGTCKAKRSARSQETK
jgi:hypothetical protein